MKKNISGINSNNNLSPNSENKGIKPNKHTIVEPNSVQSFLTNQDKDIKLQDRDLILKNNYSATLKSSAENFLVDLFEKISSTTNLEGINLEVPISAAMAIIGNISWHQPSEAQMQYDFTRECIDKGIYTLQPLDGIEMEDIGGEEDEEQIGENE
jgi:hypothetical protein